jgi:hypothetical protein
MGATQFNLRVENEEQFRADFKAAGCEIDAEWAGKKPLLVTISRKEWVSQLRPGDEVEYVMKPVRRKDKRSPTGSKVGVQGVSMTILSRADR